MQRRVVATTVLLLALIGCLTYVAVRAYVLGTSGGTIKRAAVYALNGKSERARQELNWLLWFEPRHPLARHLMGVSYLKQNDFPAAIENLQRVGEESAVDEDAQQMLASALLADQQFERAEAVLSRHILRYPKSLLTRRQFSGLLQIELRRREAIHVLEEYLRTSVSEPIPFSDQLLLLRDLSTAEFHPPLPQDCLPVLQAVLEQRGEQPSVVLALARCHVRLGHADVAEPLLRQALGQNHQDRQPRFLLCEVLIDQANPDQAERVLLDGSKNSSPTVVSDLNALEQDDRFWELRCRISECRSDHERALVEIDRAISIQPHSRDYAARRARLLQRLRRPEEAREAYARSHELARSELDLWKLSRDLGARDPSPAECEQMAQLYESLGKGLQAAAWLSLGRHIAMNIPLE